MCGDGTNDVGALKHAHVGVSILSNASIKKKKPRPEGGPLLGPAAALTPPPPSASNAIQNRIRTMNDRANAAPLSARERAIARHRDASQALLNKALKEMDEDQVQIVKLGDASIAAPFTSKSASINCGKLLFRIEMFLFLILLLFHSLSHHQARQMHTSDNVADV